MFSRTTSPSSGCKTSKYSRKRLQQHQSTSDDDGEPTCSEQSHEQHEPSPETRVLTSICYKVGPRGFPFSLQTSFSQSVGVSSMTGDGVTEFFPGRRGFTGVRIRKGPYPCVYLCYWSFDLPRLCSTRRNISSNPRRVRAQREATLEKQKEDSTARMLADLAVDRASDPNFAARDALEPR